MSFFMNNNFIETKLFFLDKEIEPFYFGNTYYYKIKIRKGRMNFVLKLIEEFKTYPTLFFSLEMAEETLKKMNLIDKTNQNLFIIDIPNLNIDNLCLLAEKYINKNKTKIIFIDYLKLLTVTDENISEVEKEELLLNKLKEFAKKNNIIIIATNNLSLKEKEDIKVVH